MSRPVVFLTGASRGLGRSTALALAQAGASLILCARSAEALESSAQEAEGLGAEVRWRALDITAAQDCRAFLDEAVGHFGRVDSVIHNAGTVDPIGPIAEAPLQTWLQASQVNLSSAFHLTQTLLPSLRASQGRLITVGTGASQQPIAGWSAYCTSKAGLLMFTRVLAAEEPGITSLSMTPGVVDTAMQERIREKGPQGMPKPLADYFLSLPASGQLVTPEVPAKALATLALKAPREWSGQELDFTDPRIAAL